MRTEEVIEIAMGAAPFLGKPDAEMVAVLESIVAEVERRTLERAAVLSETTYSHGDGVEGWFKIIAENIRALKEEV